MDGGQDDGPQLPHSRESESRREHRGRAGKLKEVTADSEMCAELYPHHCKKPEWGLSLKFSRNATETSVSEPGLRAHGPLTGTGEPPAHRLPRALPDNYTS